MRRKHQRRQRTKPKLTRCYLRDNGFKTYIVTGGGQAFVRVFSEQVYSIPSEQVIGSAVKLKYTYQDGKPALFRLPDLLLLDDEEGKPEDIELFIGRKPLAAFGNSDGDRQMLEWTQSGPGTRLMVLVHHDDAQREYAYGASSKIGTFSESLMAQAKKQGWVVISMKNDWKQIFPPESKQAAIPQLLVGKWDVIGGLQDGATFEFSRDGAVLAHLNAAGQLAVLKGKVAVESKKLLITTRNPKTGLDETKSFVIRELNESTLVVESEQGEVFNMKRGQK
jgi:uncharacterized protein (TIGR03066 family)